MDEDKSEKESSGLLANALFYKGLQKVYEYHRKIADQKKAEGNLEMAENHDKRANIALHNAILLEPAPNLSEEENVEYLKLLNKRFSVKENGELDDKKLNSEENKQLEDFIEKGFIESYPKKEQ